MAEWGSGYIVDTAYVHDYCRTQTPAILGFAALAKTVSAPGSLGEPLAYCDLGCGQGYTANLIAAANPRNEVLGADFNPTHIANARALARAAGLTNIAFREADFEELSHDHSLPDFDIVSLHGVYSWISAQHRRYIVDFISKHLKPGGLVYISYDTMPGWAGLAPLRGILVQRAASSGASASTALDNALAFAERLEQLDARFFRMYPHVSAQMDRLKKLPRSYLAHELLTRNWQAFSFADVAAELAGAKLTYLCSAYLADHVDRINFTEEQQRFVADIPDPLLGETTRDMIVGRQFRRDIFVKGATTLPPLFARERLLQTRLALSVPAEDVDLTFETALGKLALRSDIYKPVLEILDQGPTTMRELIERLPASGLTWTSLTDAVKVLVGRGDLHPALPPEGQAQRDASTYAFNRAVMTRSKELAQLGYLASPVTGAGIRVDRLTQLYLLAKQKGIDDPASAMTKIAMMTTAPAETSGSQPEDAERRAALTARATTIASRTVPLLARLGIS